MSVSWSQFGLEEPDAADRDRLVVLGGGRGVVLGVSWNRSYRGGKLDDRFHISVSQLKPASLVPRRGDIVLWRGYSPADVQDWDLWGTPTRVLDVERHDGRIGVWSLEDADLADRVDHANIDTWFVEHDRVLDEAELWTALGNWDLRPLCTRCGGELMPAVDPGPGVIIGGCVPMMDGPTSQCSRCGHAST